MKIETTPDGRIQQECDKLCAEARAELTPVEQAKLTLLEAEEKHLLAMSAAYKKVMDASRPLEDLITVSTIEYSPLHDLHNASVSCASRLHKVQHLIKFINGELPF